MKNISKALVATALLTAGSTAMAGAANLSTTQLRGSGSSITWSGGTTTATENATGWRFLNSSTGGDVSARVELYGRGTVDNSGYSEVSTGSFSMTGTIVDATRVGESQINSVATQNTRGTNWSNVAKTENGVFVAYDNVEVGGSNSSSFESGTYSVASNDYSIGRYTQRVRANTTAYSAYANYGAN